MMSAMSGAVYFGVTRVDIGKTIGGEIKATKDKILSLVEASKGKESPPPVSVKPAIDPVVKDEVPAIQPEPIVEKKPEPAPVATKKTPEPKKKLRVVKRNTPASPPAPTQTDKMKGAYVALELTSGRTVKGVLEGNTPREYKIQLPGLGVFSYSKDKVKKIELAE